MTDSGAAIVVGAGLGGLLLATHLAQRGRRVTVLEQLAVPGGRFTHLDYEGFAVPTGAFHAFPGGTVGPLAHCLRTLGVTVEFAVPDPSFLILYAGQRYPLDVRSRSSRRSGLGAQLGLRPRHRLYTTLLRIAARGLLGGDCSVADALRQAGGNDLALRLFDHLAKFAIGAPADDASMLDILRSLFAQKFGCEGFLKGGNRALVDALVAQATAHGAIFRYGVAARNFRVSGGRVTAVETDDGAVTGDLFICNTGMHRALALLGSAAPPAWVARAEKMRPACGATHAIRAQAPLHAHASIEIPLDLPSIAGIVPLSQLCPALCPPGWHYSLAYQALDPRGEIAPQLDRAQAELRAHLGPGIDIFNTATYHGTHPAAALAQCVGQHGNRRFPTRLSGLANLYFVGHDVQGRGFAAETIGDGCRRLMRRLR